MKSKVFFTREITPEKVVELYRLLGKEPLSCTPARWETRTF